MSLPPRFLTPQPDQYNIQPLIEGIRTMRSPYHQMDKYEKIDRRRSHNPMGHNDSRTHRSDLDYNLGGFGVERAVSYQLINAAKSIEGLEQHYKDAMDMEKNLCKKKELKNKQLVEDLTDQLKIADSKLVYNTRVVSEIKHASQKVIVQNEDVFKDNTKLKGQLTGLLILYLKNHKSLENYTRDNVDLRKENERFKEENYKLKALNTNLNSQLDSECLNRKQVLEKYDKDVGLLSDKLNKHSQYAESAEANHHSSRKYEDQLREQLHDMEKKYSDLMIHMNEQTEHQRVEIHQLADQNNQLQHDKSGFQGELEQFVIAFEEKEGLERELRRELARLTYINDELNEQIGHLDRKYHMAINELEELSGQGYKSMSSPQQIRQLQMEEERLRQIEGVEQKITELESKGEYGISGEGEEEEYDEEGEYLDPSQNVREDQIQPDSSIPESQRANAQRIDTDALLEEGTESFEEKFESYQRQHSHSENVLKKLTKKIMTKPELQNIHVRGLFKLDGIDIEDKSNEYNNLLKAMGALYFANKHTRLLAHTFNNWRNLTHERMQLKLNEMVQEYEEGEGSEEGPALTESERIRYSQDHQHNINRRSNSASLTKPNDLNTEYNSKEGDEESPQMVGQSDEYSNAIHIAENLESGEMEEEITTPHRTKKELSPPSASQDRRTTNMKRREAEQRHLQDSDFSQRNKNKAILKVQGSPQFNIEDISSEELHQLIYKLKEQHKGLMGDGPKLADSSNPEKNTYLIREVGEINTNFSNGITDFVFHLFVRCVDFAEDHQIKCIPVFSDVLSEMRKFSGEFIYHTLALAQKLKLLNNFGELIQEAILEEEPSDMELKEIVIEDTPREEIVEAKLFNWTAVSLRQIDAKKPLLPEHVPMYLFRLMTLIYRCTTLKGKLLLHPKHHEKIESRTLDGLLLYVKDYQRFQEDLFKQARKLKGSSEKQEAPKGQWVGNTHMFCKYPFLKKEKNMQRKY